MNIKAYIKTLHFGSSLAAIILLIVAIYSLFNQEYQRFFFYSFFAFINLGLAIYNRNLDSVQQLFTDDGRLEKTVFKLDLNSSLQIKKILNRLRVDTMLNRMEKKYLNLYSNIPFAFVPITATELEVKEACAESTPPAFFKAAVENKGTHKTAVKLFKEIIEYNKRHGIDEILCCDYDTGMVPYGLYLGEYLVNYSKKYCNLYAQFIKTLDMDHEVYEADIIYNAFKLYGCCPETLELLAVRLLPASGQHGMDSLNYYCDDFALNQYLNNLRYYNLFLKQLKNELLFMSEQYKAENPFDEDGYDDEILLAKRQAKYSITEDSIEYLDYFLEKIIITNNPKAPTSKVFHELYKWAQENSPPAVVC
ncbi:hypothetical protein [Psychromonas algicola]|uniref:hypothetical protein n=1 Tax=Psychromonas algicola TaxID=2555642 RepID=UPI001067ECC7|nr:hypothetical protein [Psychromonas sp. RZ5]TEW45729.1 hypothetical protein E2R67_13740 [Psychromonas sp. RZ5]